MEKVLDFPLFPQWPKRLIQADKRVQIVFLCKSKMVVVVANRRAQPQLSNMCLVRNVGIRQKALSLTHVLIFEMVNYQVRGLFHQSCSLSRPSAA